MFCSPWQVKVRNYAHVKRDAVTQNNKRLSQIKARRRNAIVSGSPARSEPKLTSVCMETCQLEEKHAES